MIIQVTISIHVKARKGSVLLGVGQDEEKQEY